MNTQYIQIIQNIMSLKWFFVLEFIGMVAFSISGLVLAYKHQTNFLGTFLLCLMPAFGGGLMRDLICGRHPVWFLTAKFYFIMIFFIAIIGFIFLKILLTLRQRHQKAIVSRSMKKFFDILLETTDAIGLASFTVIGVFVAVIMKSDPIWLWGPFFAFLTSTGGGILRDLLVKESKVGAVMGGWYGEIAMFWGFLLSLYLTHVSEKNNIEWIVITIVVMTFVTRMMVYIKKINNVYILPSSKKN